MWDTTTKEPTAVGPATGATTRPKAARRRTAEPHRGDLHDTIESAEAWRDMRRSAVASAAAWAVATAAAVGGWCVAQPWACVPLAAMGVCRSVQAAKVARYAGRTERGFWRAGR